MPSSTVITIQHPIAEGFRFLCEPAHLALWDDETRWARRSTDGPLGIGVTFAQETAGDGETRLAACEVVAFEPPYQFGWLSDLGTTRVITRVTLEVIGSDT